MRCDCVEPIYQLQIKIGQNNLLNELKIEMIFDL